MICPFPHLSFPFYKLRSLGVSAWGSVPHGEIGDGGNTEPSLQLASSGFSLVILAAMTWPRTSGGWVGFSKEMGVIPHGDSPYRSRISFSRCSGTPMAI